MNNTPNTGLNTSNSGGVNRNNIRIYHWNARGLLNHKAELLEYIENNQYPEVICIQETFLRTNRSPYFPNYDIIRTDSTKQIGRRGVAILIKQGIPLK